MIKKHALFTAFFCVLVLTAQASENNNKRAFTVTTIALDAQAEQEENYEDLNETNLEGGIRNQ